MTLIKSISGIRGTIGGVPGQGLTPPDVVRYTAAFGHWATAKTGIKKIVVGRDARISGNLVSSLAIATLQGLGIEVIDLGLSTTPTVEIAVPGERAAGGIILTASHNPGEWNALKLLNHQGEFISGTEGQEVLEIVEKGEFAYAGAFELGKVVQNDRYLQHHIDLILKLPLVDPQAIASAKFTIVVDGVNSTGGIFVPALLRKLGVEVVYELFCTPDGHFPHDPEPLAENLKVLSTEVRMQKASLGIAIDPDVDRLCFVCEDGTMFGEEYTLVAVGDYVLRHQKGSTVSNLSSTRALRDITKKAGCTYATAAVGEVNVVQKMKEVQAVIGGEGNGGIIYPELHYGRDALVGIALFLTHLAKSGLTASKLRQTYPDYWISKNKIEVAAEMNIDDLLSTIRDQYSHLPHDTVDGLKIEFEQGWVHLRRSNTEPIIRIYSEGRNQEHAESLAQHIIGQVQNLQKSF